MNARVLLAIYCCHALLTFLFGYVVAPRFDSMREPPPRPSATARVVGAAYSAVAWPLLLPLSRDLAVNLSRPAWSLVLLNSGAATVLVGLVSFVLRLTRRRWRGGRVNDPADDEAASSSRR